MKSVLAPVYEKIRDFSMRIPIKYKLSSLQNVVSINENDFNRKIDIFPKNKRWKTLFKKGNERLYS